MRQRQAAQEADKPSGSTTLDAKAVRGLAVRARYIDRTYGATFERILKECKMKGFSSLLYIYIYGWTRHLPRTGRTTARLRDNL